MSTWSKVRDRYARAIRCVSTLHTAVQLLEAFEREAPGALDSVEALPDWTYGTLLAWALESPGPKCLDAGELKAVREMQLIGRLSLACEEALELGDMRTAHAMAELCNTVLQRTRGAAGLRVALEIPKVEA